MPVLGHAFVGWGTALVVSPGVRGGPAPSARASVYWIPAVILLAYAPDVAAQLGLALGWTQAPRAAHSVAFALVLAPLAGFGLAVLLAIRNRLAIAVSLGSILLHDLLDLLQTPDRQPLWPFSGWHLGEGTGLIPTSGLLESLVFAGAFGLFLAGRHLVRPGGRTEAQPRPRSPVTVALVALIVAAAAMTHSLRAVRHGQLDRARFLARESRYSEALAAAADADRWPSTAHPGRVDHVRAEAFEGLGRLDEAIAGYRRAVEADPTSFWALADLAAACASSSQDDVRALAAPLRTRLAREFAAHPALPGALGRIDRRLAR